MNSRIPFNKPYIAGKELYYVAKAVAYGNISGDGYFTHECSRCLEKQLGIKKALLTNSCTSALEIAAMLCDLTPGDEVILPSFTFVSTANAIVKCGATPVFVDIRPDTLNMDEKLVEEAVTSKTKAIIPVHYAGVGCEMDTICDIAESQRLLVVEDAAQAVNAYYKNRALGSIGHMGTFSFHETKNFICGEGGALCINDETFIERAEIIRDKGTNRQQFMRGESDKYTWVDIGSSYVPSEILAAFLAAQLEAFEDISSRRRAICDAYSEELRPLEDQGLLRLPRIPEYCESNNHIFYILLNDQATRDGLMDYLRQLDIYTVFHFVPLHNSPMGKKISPNQKQLPRTEDLSSRLLRLPCYYELTDKERAWIVEHVSEFLRAHSRKRVAF